MFDANLDFLELAVHELGELTKDVVFVGGSTVGLYITDTGVPDVRATLDVDCIIEVANLNDYYQFQEKLRQRGFLAPMGAPTCRFQKGSVLLDVMPTRESPLGETNPWYGEGIIHAVKVRLPKAGDIAILTSPYFLATKLVAFKNRGRKDYRASHDLEDIIAVIDGNESLEADIVASPGTVRAFLKKEFGVLLKTSAFLESIEGHISDYQNASARAALIVQKLTAISLG